MRSAKLRVGHDRRRIGIHEHDLVALFPQRLARLHAGIIKLASLADDDWSRPDEQNFVELIVPRHAQRERMQKPAEVETIGHSPGCDLFAWREKQGWPVRARHFTQRTVASQPRISRAEDFCPNELGNLPGPFPFQVNTANALDPGENVVGRLAADADQLGADDPGDEIARKIQDFLRGRAVETLAENRSHRPGERLHFRAERHPEMGAPLFINLKINSDRVRAFLVFANILKIESLVRSRGLFRSAVGVGNERFPSFDFGQMFEEIDDVLQFPRIHHRTVIWPGRDVMAA